MVDADAGVRNGGREFVKVGEVLAEDGGEVFKAEGTGYAGPGKTEATLGKCQWVRYREDNE